MADKPKDEPSPVFKKTTFGIGDMYTRKGRGLIDDDLPTNLGSAKPGLYGPHNREEPESAVGSYAEGGMVKAGSSTRVSCKNKFGG